MSSDTRSSRIFVNALASYGRMVVSAVAGFFTVPIALHELGASDYGIFSVIAGALSFLMFVNGAMTTGAQRHLAHSLGRQEHEETHAWLTISTLVHFCLGTFVVVLGVLLSHWIVYGLLRIPVNRLGTAMMVYYLTIFLMFFDIISTPHRALLMAREVMVPLAVIGSAGAIILCAGTVSLRFLSGDKLLWYAGIYVFSQLVMMFGPSIFCIALYPECRRLHMRGVTWIRIRQLISFSGWTLLGALTGPVRAQGPAILLNRFSGSVLNASYGIAMQFTGFTSGISSGLMRATSPAIVKLEASGNRTEMIWLSNLSNKYAFVLLWLGVGPILFDARHWLSLWLTNAPPFTAEFLVLLLVALLNDQLTSGFSASVQAHGRIAWYQIAVSMATYTVIPLAYFWLRSGFPPLSALWAVVIVSILALLVRLTFVRRMLGVSVFRWLASVLLPALLIVGVSGLIMHYIVIQMMRSPIELALLVFSNLLVTSVFTWISASRIERMRLKAMLIQFSSRFLDRAAEPQNS